MDNNNFWETLHSDGIQKAVSRLDSKTTRSLTERFGTHNYHPLPISVVRAEGAFVFDEAGRDYIDCIGSYSAIAYGHLSPFIVAAVKQQLDISALTSRAVYTPELALFLEGLARFTDLDMVCPMNTGAEAVETAIKLARKWGYTVKGIPKDQAEIVVADGNFHGRTTTIVGFSSEPSYKKNFGPFTPGFVSVPFGSIAELKKVLNSNTTAVLLEPIQAESGILIPPDGYLQDVRDLCSAHNVLLVWDEIQTGFGRTGKKFAWEHEAAKPDMLCLGKALGGGLIPVAAVAGVSNVMDVFKPGDHGSTFGGNPLACVAALAAMAEMEVHKLADRSLMLGERLIQQFKGMLHPAIIEVRGRGLLIGLEVRPEVDAKHLTKAFLDAGILTKETRHHTFRFAPPLTIDEATVDEIAARTELAFRNL